ncbi:MAG: TniQ family protein [Pseudomonadota bacterium]
MIDLGLEPEPLAFRVRPQADECFDSWVDRLAAAHDTDRAGLLRHLGLDPALARIDLACGEDALEPAWRAAFACMVERLAWAVQAPLAQVRATFLACGAEAVLPRRQRHYACARCWYEARRAGKPGIVVREWILRASWRCRNHGIPLHDMRRIAREGRGQVAMTRLGQAALAAHRLGWTLRALPGALRRNAAVLMYLARPDDERVCRPPYGSYQKRFAANRYHFAGDRIRLLALAHSSRHRAAGRFERLLSARLPERPIKGAPAPAFVKRPLRHRRGFGPARQSPEVDLDFESLVSAYAAVQARRETAMAITAIFARASSVGAGSAADSLGSAVRRP